MPPLTPLQGLPEDATEAALQLLFEPLSGVRQVRVPRDANTQLGRGFAFLVRVGRGVPGRTRLKRWRV